CMVVIRAQPWTSFDVHAPGELPHNGVNDQRESMSSPLRFRNDGTFTIAQITDLHWSTGREADQRTNELTGLVLDAEQPDLVVLTGDIIDGKGCPDPAESWRQALAPIIVRGLPWSAVFGNHDDEGRLGRSELME